MVPRVRGVPVKPSGPEQDLVLIVHAVLIVVFVDVVARTIVVVIKRCGDAHQKFSRVGEAVAVPVVVGPVQDAVVVVVPRGLLFAPETTGKLFLVNVEASIVVVVGVLAVGHAVVVVVNVVDAGRTQTLGHDALIPNSLVESIVVGIGIVAVVIVVVAVRTREEIPVVLAGVVVEVKVAVHFEIVPHAVVVVINVKPIKDGVVIVVEIDGGIGEIAVDVAVNVVLEKVCTKFIGEVGLGAVV